MNYSYDKLYKLMSVRGYSLNALKELGVISDYSSRLLNSGKSVHLEHLASICIFFGVNIDDIVEIIHPPKPVD